MIDAVARDSGGGDELFRIEPQGIAGKGDFRFLVIGDPGEGDASQHSLASRYLELGHSDDVKFLVISSDVVYPAGAIEDYEAKFYLPSMGSRSRFMRSPAITMVRCARRLQRKISRTKGGAQRNASRVKADLGLTGTNPRRIDNLIAHAERLRRLYAVNAGIQRAPFFELQTDNFALLAIDTGILRTVNQGQLTWIERALDRSRGKFAMAIVGHPRIAGGHDIPPVAEGQDVAESSEKFAALYRLLATRNVKIVMAGDTHDFEYYRENVAGDARVMHHFVNGGEGAYLSIGTALDFPKQPAAADWASTRGPTSFAPRWMPRCRYGSNRSGTG